MNHATNQSGGWRIHLCAFAALLIGGASLMAETSEFVEERKAVLLAHVSLWLMVPVFALAVRRTRSAGSERLCFWLNLWAAIAYFLHLGFAVFGVFGLNEGSLLGALNNARQTQGSAIFYSNMIITFWWVVVLLLWGLRERSRWVRVQNAVFLLLLFISAVVATLVFGADLAWLTGSAVILSVTGGLLSRLYSTEPTPN